MDPFTLSTGVAGFLSLAIEISKILGAYVSDVKHAPEDAGNLLVEVDALCRVLEQLVEFLRNDAKGLNNFDSTSALRVMIDSCHKQIHDLYQKLRKPQNRSGILNADFQLKR
ncbi:hypothetical protein FPQ18DRAFT_410872 [Pyronema domesticum]|nr:hypothetical protein FPQ18DRAFT_410872 [Pyronema domesticum]